MITVLHLYYGRHPLWTSSSVNAVCSDRRTDCVTVTICQHRSTVVWVDCAKMTCCIGFFFSFLSIYMLLYKQRGLWRRVMRDVGAKTQSTLFENHKGLGLKLIFVSIKFFKILICEILNQLLLSVIVKKLNISLCIEDEVFRVPTNSFIEKWRPWKCLNLYILCKNRNLSSFDISFTKHSNICVSICLWAAVKPASSQCCNSN